MGEMGGEKRLIPKTPYKTAAYNQENTVVVFFNYLTVVLR